MNKLYEKQSYLKACEAKVISCECMDGKVYIKLDNTIFFPEEGGQYSDTGEIEYDGKVVNVLHGEVVGDEVQYQVSEEIAVGQSVLCKLDWEARYLRMQNHSGEHILSGMIHSKYGFNNVGFHLSDDSFVTLDMDGVITQEQVRELEKEVNDVVYSNIPIIDTYPSKEELVNITYRSKIEIEGQVRLITIGEGDEVVDVCACCAPHVARTGEIGIIKIISVTKYKGGVQIAILCGKRALEYINHNLDTLNRLAQSLSTHPDNVPGILENYRNDNMELKNQLSDLREKIVVENIEKMSDNDIPCLFTGDDLSALNMKNIYNQLNQHFNGFVGVFAGDDSTGYRYYAGSSSTDSRILANLMREKLGAKGGGSAEMIQGKTDRSREEILEFFSGLKD